MSVSIEEHDRELHITVSEGGFMGIMFDLNGVRGRDHGSVAFFQGRHGIEDVVNFNIPQGWTNRRAVMAAFIKLGKELEYIQNREAALAARPFGAMPVHRDEMPAEAALYVSPLQVIADDMAAGNAVFTTPVPADPDFRGGGGDSGGAGASGSWDSGSSSSPSSDSSPSSGSSGGND